MIFPSYAAVLTHPVPAGDLDPVLVHDPDDARRVHPGLAVGLHGHALVAEDADDDGAALRDAVALQVHDAGGAHVDRAEHGHDLIRRWRDGSWMDWEQEYV